MKTTEIIRIYLIVLACVVGTYIVFRAAALGYDAMQPINQATLYHP